MNPIKRIAGAVRTEWWRVFPHRLVTASGTDSCIRCGVARSIHGHFEE